MKSILLSLLFFFVCATTNLFAQNMINMLDHYGQTFYNIDANDNNEVWAVGTGIILYSSNRGDDWEEINFPYPNEELKHVARVDANTYIVSGENTYRTTNKGQDWVIVTSIVDVVNMINYSSTIFITTTTTNENLLRSTDGGNTWANIVPTSIQNVADESFVSANIGFITSENGDIWKTIDGGNNWTMISQAFLNSDFLIAFIDDTEGYTIKSDSLFKSIDGGLTWNYEAYFVEDPRDFYAFDSNVFASKFSRISVKIEPGAYDYVTDDNDQDNIYSWDIIEAGNSQYICGSGMILRKETNADFTTWVDLTPGPNEVFNAMDIQGENILISGKVRIQLSSDYGNTFTQKKADGFAFKDQVFVRPNGDLYASDGRLKKSIDNGENWNYLAPSNSSYVANTGRLIVTTNTTISTSDDDGQTFDLRQPSTSGIVINMYFYDDNFGWVMTTSGKSYRTIDGGDNWTEITFPSGSSPNAFHFVDAQIGYGSKSSSRRFYKTIDGGDTWTQLDFIDPRITINTIYFEDEMNGYIAGSDYQGIQGLVYKTENGGVDWTLFHTGHSQFNQLLKDNTKNQLWLCGDGGQLYKLNNCAGLTPEISLDDTKLTCSNSADKYEWYKDGIFFLETTVDFITLSDAGEYSVKIKGEACFSDISNEINFTSVGFQNLERDNLISAYPNPSNGIFNLTFKQSVVPQTIKLYNLNGEQVNVVTTNQGSSFSINAKFLVSGVYLLKVTTTDQFDVTRIIIQ